MKSIENVKERLIVALDTSQTKVVKGLLSSLEDSAEVFKVGLEQYLASRGKVIDYLQAKGKKVFLDLKFHDIPNTMEAAARRAVGEGAWMMTVHVSDFESLRRVAEAAADEAEKRGIVKPLIVGVTVLTSLGREDLAEMGLPVEPEELVLKRAMLAKKSGIDGVVSSPREVNKIKEVCGEGFVKVCPGIRPSWAVKGDQKRVMSPAEALQEGADYLVIGRPITQSDNPEEAAQKILTEMKGVNKND